MEQYEMGWFMVMMIMGCLNQFCQGFACEGVPQMDPSACELMGVGTPKNYTATILQ